MKDSQPVRRIPINIVMGVCALVLAVGGGVAWWTISTKTSTLEPKAVSTTPAALPAPDSSSVKIPVPSPSPLGTGDTKKPIALPTEQPSTKEQTVELWYIKETNGQFDLVSNPLKFDKKGEPSAVLTAAFNHLLENSQDADLFSEIPKGTKLQSAKVDEQGVHIDLSQEFVTGGGSTSMIGRLGQIIYTATSLDPNAQVWISVEGKPLKLLGGEGLEIAQPSSRKTFHNDFLSQ